MTIVELVAAGCTRQSHSNLLARPAASASKRFATLGTRSENETTIAMAMAPRSS